MNFSFETAPYLEEAEKYKQINSIRATFDSESIVVYQAYNPELAKAIVQNQNFHTCQKYGFKLDRMIKDKTKFSLDDVSI